MKKFFVLRERSKVSEIRAGFLQEGVFVKKGLELSLLTYVFDKFSTQPRELFSNRIRDLKRELFFHQHPYVAKDIFAIFSMRNLEEEYARHLIHMSYLKSGKIFLNQEKIKEIKETLKLSFLKKGASGNIYEEESLISVERYVLRDFFHLISTERKAEIRGVIC